MRRCCCCCCCCWMIPVTSCVNLYRIQSGCSYFYHQELFSSSNFYKNTPIPVPQNLLRPLNHIFSYDFLCHMRNDTVFIVDLHLIFFFFFFFFYVCGWSDIVLQLVYLLLRQPFTGSQRNHVTLVLRLRLFNLERLSFSIQSSRDRRSRDRTLIRRVQKSKFPDTPIKCTCCMLKYRFIT